jgi:hypothetical protein
MTDAKKQELKVMLIEGLKYIRKGFDLIQKAINMI